MGCPIWECKVFYTTDILDRKPFKVVRETDSTVSIWRPRQLDVTVFDDQFTIMIKRYENVEELHLGRNEYGELKSVLLRLADNMCALISYRIVEFSLNPYQLSEVVKFSCYNRTGHMNTWSELAIPVIETSDAVYFMGHDLYADKRIYNSTKRLLQVDGHDVTPYEIFYHIWRLQVYLLEESPIQLQQIQNFRLVNARLW